jgi:hypothetical protein
MKFLLMIVSDVSKKGARQIRSDERGANTMGEMIWYLVEYQKEVQR